MTDSVKKQLVVDGQIFQSIARHRGMGRYSEYLVSTILEQQEYSKVHVILSKDSHAPEVDTGDAKTIFKGAEIIYLDLQNSAQQSVKAAEKHNKKVINNYIETLPLEPAQVDFLILGPFQEPLVSIFPDGVSKFLIFYDLIPYLYHEQYSNEMPFEKYLEHYRLLFEADKLLTISQAVRNDLTTYLGIPIEKTESIDGAAIRSGRSPSKPTFDIPTKFVLMPTGDDPRKNNFNAVRGFEVFNSRQKNAYKLVITSSINPSEKAKLTKASANIIFSGNIDETALDWLYDKADVVLFVPETEGLGLPVLEAVGADNRVVCSSIDVFKEISSDAFYFCDHTDPSSIAAALQEAVSDSSKNLPTKEYARISHYYSWLETAKRAVHAMLTTQPAPQISKPRIAVFTPSPDGVSAIGKVVAETHASLIDYFDVDYYYENGPANINMRPNYLKYVANYYPATQFAVNSYKKYQAVFYHIGNSEYHLESIANSLYLPGYVILHDTNISDAYRVMVERDIISKQRAKLEADITQAGKLKLSNHLSSVITNQQALITHSEYAKDAIKEVSADTPATNINLPTSAPATIPERSYKHLLLGLAGIIADIKGTEVIEKLAGDSRYKKHNFSIFGFNYSSTNTMNRLRSYGNVEIATNVTDLDFVRKMRQLDVFVNYRMKYQGETSLSTLEAMRQGVVVVVRNIGWYSELPDSAVVKVESIEDIVDKLDELINNPVQLAKISKNAADYIKKNHSHRLYAEAMLEMMNVDTVGSRDILNTIKLLKQGAIKSKNDLLKAREI